MNKNIRILLILICISMMTTCGYFVDKKITDRDDRIRQSAIDKTHLEYQQAAIEKESEIVKKLRERLSVIKDREKKSNEKAKLNDALITQSKNKNRLLNEKLKEISENISCSFGSDYTRLLNNYIGEKPSI